MKRVKINAYQLGLVFKDGVYEELLEEGVYWRWNRKIILYERQGAFEAPVALNLLLQDPQLAAALEVVQVKDHELAIQFENGLLKAVLQAGEYAFWKSGAINYQFVLVDNSVLEIPDQLEPALLQHPILSPYVRVVGVEGHEAAVLFVNGHYEKLLESGYYYWWRNAMDVRIVRVDLRRQQMEVNGQEILTHDKAALRINAWAQYRVAVIEKAVLQHKDYEKQLYIAVQLALREFVAGYRFDELLDKRAELAPFVLQAVQHQARDMGVEVLNFGIRDIILPGEMKEIMNQVLVAEKRAQANSITRREETASTRSLLNTARLMEENAMLWKLREMEHVEKIAEKISHISVGGNGVLIDQLKQLFLPAQ
ncbi:slipin family protein [Niabella terrae]